MSKIKHIRFINKNGAEEEWVGSIESMVRAHPDYIKIVKIWDEVNGEKWKTIEGFDNMYEISNHRRVKSHRGNRTKFLSAFIRGGCEIVSLRKNGVSYARSITKLVRDYFE